MSFHFVTFSLICLLFGRDGSLSGAEAKSIFTTLSPLENITTTGNNGTAFPSEIPTNFTIFSNRNNSLITTESELFSDFGNYSTTMNNNWTIGNLSGDDVSLLSSLVFSNIDHTSNFSLVDEDFNADGSGSGSSPSSEIQINPTESSTEDINEQLTTDESGSGSGFGESLITAIKEMLHFNHHQNTTLSSNNTTNSSVDDDHELLWKSDPTGTEIQALMFA